jgi:hypothetical protein
MPVDDVAAVVNDNVNVVVDPGATLKTVPDCVAVLKLIAGPATLPWHPWQAFPSTPVIAGSDAGFVPLPPHTPDVTYPGDGPSVGVGLLPANTAPG